MMGLSSLINFRNDELDGKLIDYNQDGENTIELIFKDGIFIESIK